MRVHLSTGLLENQCILKTSSIAARDNHHEFISFFKIRFHWSLLVIVRGCINVFCKKNTLAFFGMNDESFYLYVQSQDSFDSITDKRILEISSLSSHRSLVQIIMSWWLPYLVSYMVGKLFLPWFLWYKSRNHLCSFPHQWESKISKILNSHWWKWDGTKMILRLIPL